MGISEVAEDIKKLFFLEAIRRIIRRLGVEQPCRKESCLNVNGT